ncbi:hypothetical protein B0H34DRAFT_729447, partial [Crassisporium funariophilum]
MPPRFANPHLLQQTSRIVTRAEIYANDAEISGEPFRGDPHAIELLQRLVESSLPSVPRYEPEEGHTEFMNMDQGEEGLTEPLPEVPALFRLVSSALPPLPVSLLPPPALPPITREPDVEDNELQADLREQRAKAAAVDTELIFRESGLLSIKTFSERKTLTTRAPLSEPSPQVMVIERLQPPRKTRPPVQPTKLSHYPYTSDVSTIPSSLGTKACQTIDGDFEPSEIHPAHRRGRRRRKGALLDKERPPPQFWTPSPLLKGKCRGYAYGYPSYLAAAEGPVDKTRWKYQRDTMRKAIPVESI